MSKKDLREIVDRLNLSRQLTKQAHRIAEKVGDKQGAEAAKKLADHATEVHESFVKKGK